MTGSVKANPQGYPLENKQPVRAKDLLMAEKDSSLLNRYFSWI